MVAKLFGYVSYDVIRLIENLPNTNNDALGVPDIRLISHCSNCIGFNKK